MTTTDSNGMYGFEILGSGSYVVRISSSAGYRVASVWMGQLDEEGKWMAPNAENSANPKTGSTACKEYRAGDD